MRQARRQYDRKLRALREKLDHATTVESRLAVAESAELGGDYAAEERLRRTAHDCWNLALEIREEHDDAVRALRLRKKLANISGKR